MTSKLSQPWISFTRIEELVQLEPALMLVGLCSGAWLAYKIFLSKVSGERHRLFHRLFRNLFFHLFIGTALFCTYWWTHFLAGSSATGIGRVASHIGLLTLISASIVFVKGSRILLFEYLFRSHMRVGVPLLLTNLFTLLLSIIVFGWLITEVFSVKLTPLIATSAVFSLVLGLALQDTLGNLFAGVALQVDKPYEIGDWIEVHNGGQKWAGQVHEISWRATLLIGIGEETIVIPNRVMSGAQISNFATKIRPIVRIQNFRLPYGTDLGTAKNAFLRATSKISGIRQSPSPAAIVTEAADSWLSFRVIYFIDDYGAQFTIGDQLIQGCLEELANTGIECASPRIVVHRTNQSC